MSALEFRPSDATQVQIAQSQLDRVEEASELRVQNAVEAALGALEKNLEASEANCQALAQRNTQLLVEITGLYEQLKALTIASQEQKRASDARLQAEIARGQAVASAVRAKCDQIVAQAQAAAPPPLANCVRGLSPRRAAHSTLVHQERTAQMNAIIATAKTLINEI